MKPTIKFMNDKGKEAEPEKATHALVTEYTKEGKIKRETFGKLGAALDDFEVDEHAQK